LHKHIAITSSKAIPFCNAGFRENIGFAASLHKQWFEQRTPVGGQTAELLRFGVDLG
jgi:hypothetical protein